MIASGCAIHQAKPETDPAVYKVRFVDLYADGDGVATLQELLGSFDRYAGRFSSFLSVFNNYAQFKELLAYFSQGSCSGCRNGDCLYPECGVAECYRHKEVDFCFQCDEFPCEKTNFDPDLKQRWVAMNTRMKEIGVEAYYAEIKDMARYK